MANKKETTAKKTTTKKAPAKRPTAAQKLKLANEKIELLTLESKEALERAAKLEAINEKNHLVNINLLHASSAIEIQLEEEQQMRDQFFHDVEALVKKYEGSNWFNRIFNAIRLVGSFIQVINYYKEATNEKG